MRALLLAAGLGTRLRPLTDFIPKCLVPIKGVPLLETWIQQLGRAGIGPFLVNTHYLAHKVEEFVHHSQDKEKITLVYEPHLLGTAGTLIKNLEFFKNEDCILIHADNYCLANIDELMLAHARRPKGCLMTMMTFRTADPPACGIVELDKHGIVVGFHEKVGCPPGNLANGAVYILSKELLKKLTTEMPDATDFTMDVVGSLMGQIFTYETNNVFIDIGTPENYALANS